MSGCTLLWGAGGQGGRGQGAGGGSRLYTLCYGALCLSSRSRTRPLLFRGRIPMENLDVEDIEDGTGTHVVIATN